MLQGSRIDSIVSRIRRVAVCKGKSLVLALAKLVWAQRHFSLLDRQNCAINSSHLCCPLFQIGFSPMTIFMAMRCRVVEHALSSDTTCLLVCGYTKWRRMQVQVARTSTEPNVGPTVPPPPPPPPLVEDRYSRDSSVR